MSIFAGAAGFVGFVVALIIGGDTGAAIAIAVKAQWFPLVIKVASVSVGLGLIGMYCGKEEALSMAADKKEAEEDLKRNLEEARENKEQK